MKIAKIFMLIAGLSATLSAAELPQIIAHRGGSMEQAENTISAMKNSYEKGMREFEFDVFLTTDKRVVLLHDSTLDRTTTGTGRISDKSSAELADVKIKKNGEALPYLEDVIEFLKTYTNTRVHVEIKSERDRPDRPEEIAKIAFAMFKENKIDSDRIIFVSFDHRPLKAIKALDPSWKVCIMKDVGDAQLLKDAKEIGAEWLSLNIDFATRAFIREAHQAGLKTTVWTVHNDMDAQLVMALGSDSVNTDIPAAQLEKKTARP